MRFKIIPTQVYFSKIIRVNKEFTKGVEALLVEICFDEAYFSDVALNITVLY
jgi:hypothetical protein